MIKNKIKNAKDELKKQKKIRDDLKSELIVLDRFSKLLSKQVDENKISSIKKVISKI